MIKFQVAKEEDKKNPKDRTETASGTDLTTDDESSDEDEDESSDEESDDDPIHSNRSGDDVSNENPSTILENTSYDCEIGNRLNGK